MSCRSALIGASLSFALTACSKAPSAAAPSAAQSAAPPQTTDAISFAADPCEAVFNARVAQAKVPFISQITVTQRGAAMSSESRNVDGRAYARVDGRWRSTPMTTDQMIGELAEVRLNSKQRCKNAADDIVESEPAAVFAVHMTADGTTINIQLWVSKRTGLPLRAQSIIDAGQTVEQRFSYVGVTAPAEAS